MTWTYSGNPSSSDLDEVRFLIGDTDTTDQLISNEEIAWALVEYPNTRLAGSLLCRTLAAKYARLADKNIGDLAYKYSSLKDAYYALADDLANQATAFNTGLPFAGGINLSQKSTNSSNSDRDKEYFRRKQFDSIYGAVD